MVAPAANLVQMYRDTTSACTGLLGGGTQHNCPSVVVAGAHVGIPDDGIREVDEPADLNGVRASSSRAKSSRAWLKDA